MSYRSAHCQKNNLGKISVISIKLQDFYAMLFSFKGLKVNN